MRMRPSLLLMAAAVILASTTGSARAASSAQAATTPTTGQELPRKRPPLPKIVNLQILPKDTPPEEVIRIMRGFQGQLGVECNFCHVSDPKTHHLNFASDAKSEKAAGRLMMSMTHEINSKYLKQLPPMDHHHEDGEGAEHDAEGAGHGAEHAGHSDHAEHADHDEHAARVTCGTCHRGHAHPQAFVPPPEEEHEGEHHQHQMAPGPQK